MFLVVDSWVSWSRASYKRGDGPHEGVRTAGAGAAAWDPMEKHLGFLSNGGLVGPPGGHV